MPSTLADRGGRSRRQHRAGFERDPLRPLGRGRRAQGGRTRGRRSRGRRSRGRSVRRGRRDQHTDQYPTPARSTTTTTMGVRLRRAGDGAGCRRSGGRVRPAIRLLGRAARRWLRCPGPAGQTGGFRQPVSRGRRPPLRPSARPTWSLGRTERPSGALTWDLVGDWIGSPGRCRKARAGTAVVGAPGPMSALSSPTIHHCRITPG